MTRRSLVSAGRLSLSMLAGQGVPLPPFKADTERQSGPPPEPLPPSERVGFAVVGLGNLSVRELLPAFGQCRKAKPAALVSGSPEKARKLAREYGIAESSVYGYDDYARLAENREVQVVYIVLPNGLHREHAIRAFEAGKHVLCEKPMANSARECEEMLAASMKAQRHLMVAYRIQYEPNNRHVHEVVRSGRYGPVKLIEMSNVQRQGAADQWRHKRALAGGGALTDIGLYCLNTSRFLLGEEWIGMDPAFSYSGLKMEEARAEGQVERRTQPSLEEKNQFALEMDHFVDSVRENRRPFTPGEEGLQDHRIMEATYESAKSRKPVVLKEPGRRDAFRGPEPKQG